MKKDRTVYLYDGSPKHNQGAQFAVLNFLAWANGGRVQADWKNMIISTIEDKNGG